jgi:hypothetical protein
MRGSHNMAIKRVLVTIKGGKQRRKKNKGWGGREIHRGDRQVSHCHMWWWSKGFPLPRGGGNWKVFDHHNCMVMEFGCHLMTSIKFGHHQMMTMNFNRPWWIKSIFDHHLGFIKWWLNIFLVVQWQPIFKDVFEGIWVLKCNFWFIF